MGVRKLILLASGGLLLVVFQNCAPSTDGYDNGPSSPPISPPPVVFFDVEDHEPDFSISELDTGVATIQANGNLITALDPAVNGQNSTDDAAAVQRALNLAPANSVIYFPSGTFNFSNTVNVKSGITLAAQGVVVLNMLAADSRPIFKVTNGSSNLISGLNFRRGGILVSNTAIHSDVIIQSNSFSNIPGIAISASNLKSSRIYGNRFTNVGRSINYVNNLAKPGDQFSISSNVLSNVGSMGISVTGSGAGTVNVTNNNVSFNANHALSGEFGISVNLGARGDAAVHRNRISTLQAGTASCTELGLRIQARVGQANANQIRGNWCQPVVISEAANLYSVLRNTLVCAYKGTAEAIDRVGDRNAKTGVLDTQISAVCPAN
jgi:hypothetical protein